MFLNIQIDLIILKTYDQQLTLTTKKSLHITFNKANACAITYENGVVLHSTVTQPHSHIFYYNT